MQFLGCLNQEKKILLISDVKDLCVYKSTAQCIKAYPRETD